MFWQSESRHVTNVRSSTFRKKKNLQQHMRKQHGLQKYKCNHCDFCSNDQSNLKRHEKTNHIYELFQCKQCKYTTPRKDKLNQHIRFKHIEKNLKCEQCNFVTDRNDYLKKHVSAIHALKKCKECDFETYLQKEWNKNVNHSNQRDFTDLWDIHYLIPYIFKTWFFGFFLDFGEFLDFFGFCWI